MTRTGETRRSFATRLLLKLVLFYQYTLSPLKMGSTCRFEPTCSAYALDALRHYGAVKGTWLSVRRLAKCGPWHPGGFDPVPGAASHDLCLEDLEFSDSTETTN